MAKNSPHDPSTPKPGLPDIQLAMQFHRAGRLSEAATIYQEILAHDPGHLDALHKLGILLAQLGRNDLAADFLLQAIAIAPRLATLHSSLAEAYRRMDKLDDAAAAARQAIALDANLPEAHYNLGVILAQQQQPRDAILAYQRALMLSPRNLAVIFNLANALRAIDRLDDAISAYREAIIIKPDYAPAHGNLGIALHTKALQDPNRAGLDQAIVSFQHALELTPDDPIAHASLANALKDAGHREEAFTAYRRAIALDPSYAEAYTNLGKAQEDAGHMDEALTSYCAAVALKPQRPEPYLNLAIALDKLGRRDEAAPYFKQALDFGPLTPEARFHIASITGQSVPPAAPAAHVVAVFDELAERFDQHLINQLQYRVPLLLCAAIFSALQPASARAPFSVLSPPAAPTASLGDVLDLGCGTGLCAPLLRPHARTLAGVDLSPAMIRKARERKLYDELIVGDLTTTLLGRPHSLDLALAADVFVYLGDLEPVFAAAAIALRPGGVFAFSVEALDSSADGAAPPYVLRPTRRYAHAASYLTRLAAAHGFAQLALTSATLRLEALHEIAGLIVVLRKMPQT